MTKFTSSKLLIASSNKGKINEFIELFKAFDITIVSATDFSITEPDENGSSFIENAEIKAKYYGEITNLPALADDSGLCVDALDGAPGIFSARWAGPNKDFSIAMHKIQSMLKQHDVRTARFVCALSLYNPTTKSLETVQGIAEGTISFPARGNNGFGYDPIFIPNGYNETFAELSNVIKQQISHRSKAMVQLINKSFS
jgi:XTP/dITP diphosphohydrolase